MDPKIWERLGALFHGALDRPPAERAAFLAQACSNEALRVEVEAMLAGHRAAGVGDEPERILPSSRGRLLQPGRSQDGAAALSIVGQGDSQTGPAQGSVDARKPGD